MISGNVHNLTTFQVPNSFINTTDQSMFAARSVRPGPTSDLKQDMLRIAGGDEQRADLLEDIAKDGGQARFKELLKRVSSAADEPGGRSIRSIWKNQFEPVYAPENQFEPRSNEELTSNHKYVRVGNTNPDHLKEMTNGDGESIYKFRTHARAGDAGSVAKNIELSNCFYKQDEGGDTGIFSDSVYRANPELAKHTGAYLNECSGIGKFVYCVEFDANIKTTGPASATIFRLIPHSEGLLFISNRNKVRSLNAERKSVEQYNRMVDRGKRFEQSGESPFTINVENHNRKHFLTIKARCDYAQFKDADNRCDIPFAGAKKTPTFAAKCCKEGDRQLQDTKYLYVAPLKQRGWFNVKFRIVMPEFKSKSETATGEHKVNIFINDQNVVNTDARVGNNNQKVDVSLSSNLTGYSSSPVGYHVQFGIADASGVMVVKIKDPKVQSYESTATQSDIPFPNLADVPYSFISGECQPITGNRYPNTLSGVLDKLAAQEDLD